MDKQQIKEVLLDQSRPVDQMIGMRRDIEEKLPNYLNNDLITIITGMRRVGKSTLLQRIRQKYEQSDFYMDFDDERLINFAVTDFQALHELFIEMYGPQHTFFFDEMQNIPGWERFVRRLHDQGYKVFVTGSNATMLSRELGTHLTGRHSSLVLYPFSFHEFLILKAPELLESKYRNTVTRAQIKQQFNAFVKCGGIPFQAIHNDAEYLSTLYENILYRDIIARHKVGHEHAIKILAHYLASNIGKEISFNNLKKMIGVSNHTTVSEYCHFFENSYLCYLLNVFNYSLQKQTRHQKKIYFNDVAMAAKIGFRHSADDGRILENIVYLELRRRVEHIFFHKKEKECDFLVQQDHKIIAAYQVTQSLANETTKTREYNGLIEAMETYQLAEGLILTEDERAETTVQVKGKQCKLVVQPVWEWLLAGY